MTGSDRTRAAESAPLHGSVHSNPIHIGDKHPLNLPDRLSELPDSLILKIFSYMPIKDVARTSCLSTRWRKLLAPYPDLDFRHNYEPVDLLPAFIDKILLHRGSSTIRKFKLSAFGISYETVNSWIENVVKCNVVDLTLYYFCSKDGDVIQRPLWTNCIFNGRSSVHLNYFCCTDGDQLSPSTNCIFNCKSLVHLNLVCCKLHLPSNICLPSLKTLFLQGMELQDNCLERLLLGCPFIEILELIYVSISKVLKISIVNPHIQSLTIVDCAGCPNQVTRIEIFAPHLLSLNITELTRNSYHLLDLSSLVSVSVLDSHLFVSKDTATKLLGLLQQVTHVEVLRLSNSLILSLADVDTTDSRLFLCAKTLKSKLGLHYNKFRGLDYLFKHSKLESLVLDIIPEPSIWFLSVTKNHLDDKKKLSVLKEAMKRNSDFVEDWFFKLSANVIDNVSRFAHLSSMTRTKNFSSTHPRGRFENLASIVWVFE